jgi:hypothetical protein
MMTIIKSDDRLAFVEREGKLIGVIKDNTPKSVGYENENYVFHPYPPNPESIKGFKHLSDLVGYIGSLKED